MNTFKTLLFDFACLFYPHLCAACNASLGIKELGICTRCRYKLPNALYDDADNPTARKLWGRFPFRGATALFEFRKGNRVQKLIHQIKYQGRTDVAEAAGKMLGAKLKKQPSFKDIDAVVEVPMHPRKIRVRGYNQAWHIAMGVCQAFCLPEPMNHLLIKTKNISSQTKKGRHSRSIGLMDSYSLSQKASNIYHNRHYLLIDDVITTGATIEACATQLLKIRGASVSIAALADVNY